MLWLQINEEEEVFIKQLIVDHSWNALIRSEENIYLNSFAIFIQPDIHIVSTVYFKGR
jgi:hypothetical protein